MRKQAFIIVMLELIFIKRNILTPTHHFAWFSLDRVMKLWLLSFFMSELRDEVYTLFLTVYTCLFFFFSSFFLTNKKI